MWRNEAEFEWVTGNVGWSDGANGLKPQDTMMESCEHDVSYSARLETAECYLKVGYIVRIRRIPIVFARWFLYR